MPFTEVLVAPGKFTGTYCCPKSDEAVSVIPANKANNELRTVRVSDMKNLPGSRWFKPWHHWSVQHLGRPAARLSVTGYLTYLSRNCLRLPSTRKTLTCPTNAATNRMRMRHVEKHKSGMRFTSSKDTLESSAANYVARAKRCQGAKLCILGRLQVQ